MRTFNISSFLLILVLALVYVGAEVSITHPVEHSEWRRGEDVSVAWIIDAADLAETVSIELREGPKANLALTVAIATDVDANEESYDWSVPDDLEPGEKYSIRIVTDKGVERYSHYFKIN
ncbi:hypothetical protein K7432_004396 [Basidiobolus ranarum]|uniref:Yeast cell wall synthesis Kre9/Knh1-like N-terminal domain-containing protein n=1 Tax=Basidiobolus ranarum TaxID=34480 RepID=A0ABR2WY57_9FUNG